MKLIQHVSVAVDNGLQKVIRFYFEMQAMVAMKEKIKNKRTSAIVNPPYAIRLQFIQ
jgi:hypothetical protein